MARGMAAWTEVAGELIAVGPRGTLPSSEAPDLPQLVRDEVIHLMGEAVMSLASYEEPMNSEGHQKVQAEHLGRNAFLYVRQSTLRQVQENVESSQRQYGLRDRAFALGWRLEQVVVIDCDQGQSGSSAVEREGFQQLVAEVSMNRAGIVMGLEVSRLARNSSDWHRSAGNLCTDPHAVVGRGGGL